MSRPFGAGRRFAVVGGGMLGLGIARRLRERGADVTLFEAAPGLGGLASEWQIGDVSWDRHYHVTLAGDGALHELLRELDLEREIEWKETRSCVFDGRGLHSISSALDLLRLPQLGALDLARLGLSILVAARIRDWRRLEGIPVSVWLRRWAGRRGYERFWRPLLRSKLGEAYRDTSAAFFWATIQRLYGARRSGLKREQLGYVRGGYARILSALAERLGAAGVRLETGQRIEAIEARGKGIELRFENGRVEGFDDVVVTLAPPIAARVCRGLQPDEVSRLTGVRYLGVVCASVLLDRPLAGYYVTNLLDGEMPFTGVIEMTALVDREQFGGKTLVYLPRYAEPGDAWFQYSDEEIREVFLAGLRRVYPSLGERPELAFKVSRAPYVMPISTLHYSANCPPIRTSVPGLTLASSANIANATLNVNETLQLADDVVEQLEAPR